MAHSFPEEVLGHVFSFIHCHKDRNSVSVVCKSWYEVERWCRRKVFIGNCYSVSPNRVIRRFPELRSLSLKGKPHFADFDLVPAGWGGNGYPWIATMVAAYPWLEELRLKRMVVTDDSLELISSSFKNFKVLVLSTCDGFTTNGLTAIASNCRNLRVLDLTDSEIDDQDGNWINHFPDTFTSLESLNISCLASEVTFSTLERLVSRSPNLTSLKLNRAVHLDWLPTLLVRAPQLVELGTGAYTADLHPEVFSNLSAAFSACKNLKVLSGFWDVMPAYLPALYPICSGISSLNLSYASIRGPDLVKFISQCHRLQSLWVLDYIEDSGLEVLGESCKDLEELRVFPSDPFGQDPNTSLTEKGLVSICRGCPNLQSVLYFCHQMSNTALVSIAQCRSNLTRFRLCIIEPREPDYLTLQPLDEGFGAIVRNCKNLRRLSLSGLLTDRVFKHIGCYGKNLEMLSIAFAGDTDLGLHHVLSGCGSLRKLEIRDCPFGDKALLANTAKLEKMRSLWMSSCFVSFGACKILGQRMNRLNVEVIEEPGSSSELRPDGSLVDKLYIYRTVVGPRFDLPDFVWTMDDESMIGVS